MTQDHSVFTYSTQVFSHDSDMKHRMTMAALLKAVQVVAGKHLDEQDMTIDNLTKNNSLFVLVKISANIFKTPLREEALTLQTWTREKNGIVFIRDTAILNAKGEKVAECSANWILINPLTREILRPEVLPYAIAFCPQNALIGTRTGRLRTPNDMEAVGQKRVDYTDCDFIGHMNNTHYADIVTNFLPQGAEERDFKKLDIAYHQEARFGEELTIFRKEEDGILWFKGTHARGKCFEAMVELK